MLNLTQTKSNLYIITNLSCAKCSKITLINMWICLFASLGNLKHSRTRGVEISLAHLA